MGFRSEYQELFEDYRAALGNDFNAVNRLQSRVVSVNASYNNFIYTLAEGTEEEALAAWIILLNELGVPAGDSDRTRTYQSLQDEFSILSTNQGVSTGNSPTFAGLTVNGDIVISGTVDGRDLSVDGTKLDSIIEIGAGRLLTQDELDKFNRITDTGSGKIITDDERLHLLSTEVGATADQTGEEIKALYETQPNTNAFTDSEKTKLANFENPKFRGEFVNLSALQTAEPNPEIGSFAFVDLGAGENTVTYIWDSTDQEWIQQVGTGTAETPASIKSKYESNADTNAFTDVQETKVNAITNTGSGMIITNEERTALGNTVRLTGDQTIGGSKTFSGVTNIQNWRLSNNNEVNIFTSTSGWINRSSNDNTAKSDLIIGRGLNTDEVNNRIAFFDGSNGAASLYNGGELRFLTTGLGVSIQGSADDAVISIGTDRTINNPPPTEAPVDAGVTVFSSDGAAYLQLFEDYFGSNIIISNDGVRNTVDNTIGLNIRYGNVHKYRLQEDVLISESDFNIKIGTSGNNHTFRSASFTPAAGAITGLSSVNSYQYLNRKTINIGSWNMDVTQTVNVTHGLTLSNIRGITVMIISDGGELDSFLNDGSIRVNSSIVTLTRGSSFTGDQDYTGLSNRGYVIIDYV